jgi:hypothetical protein
MLTTPGLITECQQALGAHRGRNDQPDDAIVRKILMAFQDAAAFRLSVVGLAAGLDPSEITGEGDGIDLSDAQRWIENGGRRPPKRRAQSRYTRWKGDGTDKTTASPYFDPTTITGQPSTCQSTMDPRRRGESRKHESGQRRRHLKDT